MDYIMAPGARLEIGPRGTPYEQLGACCSGCAKGGGCRGLGEVPFSANVATVGLFALGLWFLLKKKR